EKGKPKLIGYGIPPVEMFVYEENEDQIPPDDSIRYAPPERIEGEEEDVSSDVFSLILVAMELASGKALYPGEGAALEDKVAEGKAVDLLERIEMSEAIDEVLAQALDPDPAERFEDAAAFVAALKETLADAQGDGLEALMERLAEEERHFGLL